MYYALVKQADIQRRILLYRFQMYKIGNNKRTYFNHKSKTQKFFCFEGKQTSIQFNNYEK